MVSRGKSESVLKFPHVQETTEQLCMQKLRRQQMPWQGGSTTWCSCTSRLWMTLGMTDLLP